MKFKTFVTESKNHKKLEIELEDILRKDKDEKLFEYIMVNAKNVIKDGIFTISASSGHIFDLDSINKKMYKDGYFAKVSKPKRIHKYVTNKPEYIEEIQYNLVRTSSGFLSSYTDILSYFIDELKRK